MFGKFVNALSRGQIVLGTVLLIGFFVAVTLQIASRYIGVSLMWTEEVAQYAFIWAAFMGGSAMVHRNQHFVFSSFRDRVSGKGKIYYDIVVIAVMLIFVGVMAVIGWYPVMRFWHHRWISIPSFTMGYVWLCIPITGVTCSLYLFHHIVLEIGKLRKGGTAQ